MAERMDYIYCSNCQSIQRLLRDPLPADDRNDHAAEDLVCRICALVIATLHEKRTA